MQFVILPSKFIPPLPAPFVIRRKRLLTQLKKNLSRKVVLINAGAGYGKTTLSAQLFQSIPHHKLFFTIEEEDKEPTFFSLSLIKGLQKFFPELSRYTQEILRRSEDSIPFLKRVVKSVLNDILYSLKGDLYLFFDAEKDLPNNSETVTLIDSLITYSSKNVHFVFSQRYPLSIESIPKLKLEGNVFEIEEKELLFTKEEIKTLLRKIYKKPVEEKTISRLLRYSRGWIAGIQIITQREDGMGDFTKGIKKFARAEKDLTDYFLNRVIKRTPKKIQKFLVQSSILKELNIRVLETIFEKMNVKKTLQYLEETHTFTFCIDPKKGIYRYHPLFQKFLLNLMDERRKKELHQIAGNYFASQKDYNQALYHFVKAQDHSQIVSVLEDYAPFLWKQGKVFILKKSLQAVPEEIIKQSPHILLCRVKLKRLERKYEETESELLLCIKRFAERKELNRVYEAKIYLMIAKQKKGFTDEALSKAKELYNKLLKSKNRFPVELKILFLSEIAGIYYEIQDYNRMEESLKTALQYLRLINSPKWECTIKGNLAILDAHNGNFQNLYDTLNSLWERYRFQYPLNVQYICANLINCEIIFKEFNNAQFHAEWLLEHSKRYHQDFLSLLAYNFLAKISFLLKKPQKALDLLKKAQGIALSIGNKAALCSVYETFLEYHLYNKQYNSAKMYLKILEEEECPVVNENKFFSLKGKIFWGIDMKEKALRFLKDSLRMANKDGDNFAKAETLWILAILLYSMGREDKSIRFAKQSLRLIHRKKYYFLFSFDKQERSLWKFLLSSIEIDKTLLTNILGKTNMGRELIGIEKQKEEQISVITKTPSYFLSFRFFGDFQIFLGQKRVEIKWHSAKTLSLFAYLSARPGFHSVDLLIENFWPDSSLHKACSSLYTAISYIRKHLSPFIKTVIENEKKSYRLNSGIPVKRDIEEFENFYRLGKKFENEQNLKLCIENYEMAKNIYRGDFLENLYDPWTEEERNYYQGKYLNILKMQGNLYKKTGAYLDAKNCFLTYISYEPYEEETYCELFEILSHLKDKKNLQELYKRLIKYLEEISSVPSLTTKESYHKALTSF